ncbi:RnfABCDGE type electron transport complex subunit D, partial [Candidatus Bathyarchaeota archaeon]|nr:RnfABCDGE type electron transport complex subunit D [Candidatus Bathyarchaeota archaeon]
MPSISTLMPTDHIYSIDLQNRLTEGIFGPYYPMDTQIFGPTLITCYGNPGIAAPTYEGLSQVLNTMALAKYHGWIGGASSIVVIAVGIILFAVLRRYIKWRITVAYLLGISLLSIAFGFIYGGDIVLRLIFHVFAGSSIFMAFFMATDPATTPVTHKGQLIFGAGLSVLTMLIMVYTGFLGGSIIALVIMNLTSPLLDNVGKLRPKKEKTEPKLPKAKQFATVKTYDCMRCGACMNVCCNALSPILIKEAVDKQNVLKLMELNADYCAGCEHCNFVCPSKIDLESNTLGYPLLEEEAKTIEQQFLKGKIDENIGVYSDVFAAKSSIDGQDGGVATALLASGLKKGLFDSAIVVQRTDGYWAEAVVAENVDEVSKAKGTKYLRVAMMSKLGELVAKGKRKIAIVGTACEVRAARRVQQTLLRELPDVELTMLGLFCYECFDYEKLKEETTRLLGVDLDRAEKTQIHKGKYIVQVDGKEHSVSV